MGQKDSRDEKTWVVLELSRHGEIFSRTEDLSKILESLFPEVGVFLPSINLRLDGRAVHFSVMDGYCFVGSGLPTEEYFRKVEDSPYLNKVLYTKSRNLALHTVPNTTIEELKHKLSLMVSSDIKEGDRVLITKGVCENLEGVVLSVDQDAGEANVLLETRTLKTIRRLPCFSLFPLGDDDV